LRSGSHRAPLGGSLTILALVIIALAAAWVGWRLRSKRALLPCPAEFAWLVEMENPLARATNSDHVVRQLALSAGARVMDIGCGPGRVTIPLAHAVGPDGEALALDVQAAMLARVAEKAAKEDIANIRLIESDVRSASIQSGALDAAVMVMALGEVPEGASVFPFIFSALKPGGRLLVAESIFDPHFMRRAKVREQAAAAGFAERAYAGNIFGYSLVFEKTGGT
jgi:ubiquinone/menaquinone biosynthesis C-methylase UbiE